ncbi:MAG TPA: hypothetical protein RMH99_32880 [Sandaracinaceae bacterium LLY-WYZ-13_1]|nr:hypothetical protein [Sandaracinaceae bacterium LLY-WYZ-13_1]
MSDSLRPCSRCGRHARTDEARCPFCGAELPFGHRLPVVPLREARPAPKYGAPPLVQASRWALLLAVVGGLASLIWYLLGRR